MLYTNLNTNVIYKNCLEVANYVTKHSWLLQHIKPIKWNSDVQNEHKNGCTCIFSDFWTGCGRYVKKNNNYFIGRYFVGVWLHFKNNHDHLDFAVTYTTCTTDTV